MTRKMVAVVDYGSGNLRSVSQAVMHVARLADVDVCVTSSPRDVMAAERVVCPARATWATACVNLQSLA
jgi:imidazole glycerol-phosphate synthase subunit HisH